MTDWKDCALVRDEGGTLWLRNGDRDERWTSQYGSDFHTSHMGEEITPVLDAEGHPVVTTVGDLTARHIGRLIRAETEGGEVREGRLRGIAPSPDFGVQLAIGGGYYAAHLEAPCEVIA